MAKDFGDARCLIGEEVVAYLKKEACSDVGCLVGRLTGINGMGICLGKRLEGDVTATTAWIPLHNVAFLAKNDEASTEE